MFDARADSVILAAILSLPNPASSAPDPGPGLAPHMDFVPNSAGTYQLQRIQQCPDGVLLNASASARRLSAYTRGKVTLLTFFYTYCTDPWGCPFAYQTMKTLRDRIASDASDRSRVRFVSISFDPSNDTPDALRSYAQSVGAAPGFEWQFFTARTMAELSPLLDGFGQDVRVETDASGRPTRAINHMLKLFLIDTAGSVREIYSLAFVHPEVMLNDIRTLLMEFDRSAARN
ncbi:MAG TPA: SCO family protein [Burkholderiaceae bacterium]|nr:SCO family protein [Burkholderiaceae bacterium]